MPDLDLSELNEGLLAESWYVALGDYIIDVVWAPDASKLAAVTAEGEIRGAGPHRGTKYR